MPYTVTVTRVHGRTAELEVVPEQPDCEPFSLDRGFAVGLLLAAAHTLRRSAARATSRWVAVGPLGRELDVEAFDTLAAGGGRPERFVGSVAFIGPAPLPWSCGQPTPTARYRIEATDPRWIEHLTPGRVYVSYAYTEKV